MTISGLPPRSLVMPRQVHMVPVRACEACPAWRQRCICTCTRWDCAWIFNRCRLPDHRRRHPNRRERPALHLPAHAGHAPVGGGRKTKRGRGKSRGRRGRGKSQGASMQQRAKLSNVAATASTAVHARGVCRSYTIFRALPNSAVSCTRVPHMHPHPAYTVLSS